MLERVVDVAAPLDAYLAYALGGNRRANAFVDHLHDLELARVTVHHRDDQITDTDGCCWLRRATVHLHVTTATRVCCE